MRVITLASGSGGAGRTFVAATLGLALARRGVRTCLVDLDVESSDLHLRLGMRAPARGVHDLLAGRIETLAEAMVDVPGHDNLHLVAGCPETLRITSLRHDDVEQLALSVLDLPAEVVVVDLPDGTSPQALDLFLFGDIPLAVTTPESSLLAGTAHLLRLARLRYASRGIAVGSRARRPRVYTSLDELVRDMREIRRTETVGPAASFEPGVVVNRYRAEADAPVADLLARLRDDGTGEAPVLRAEIPEDAFAERSVDLMTPLYDIAPVAPSALALDALALSLAAPITGTTTPTPPIPALRTLARA